jgi:hypothetical protein
MTNQLSDTPTYAVICSDRYNSGGVAAAESRLNRPFNWDLPSKQEKVPAAKRATLGQDNPVKRFLDGVSDAYTSKIDRSAIWTVRRCHSLQYPIPGQHT